MDTQKEKKAAIFPGQGSQYVGMGKGLYREFNSVRQLYEKANDITGLNLSEISFNGPEAELRRTQFTQPAIFLHSIAHYSLIEDKIDFSMVAGHSLGEYTALVASGVLSFEDALRAVKLRGDLMAKSGEKPGTMLAVMGMDIETLSGIVDDLSKQGIITIANYNAPGQVAVSGEKELLMCSVDLFKKAGAKRVIPLPVSGAFHSPLMEEAGLRMREVLEDLVFRVPRVSFYPNVLGEEENSPSRIRELLISQITSPVRWIRTIGNMVSNDVETFFEIGPGKVLSGLIKRIFRDANIKRIDGVQSIKDFL